MDSERASMSRVDKRGVQSSSSKDGGHDAYPFDKQNENPFQEDEEQDEDEDSIYRFREEKSKPTCCEMISRCVSCKHCVCLACVITLILLAVTVVKSALQSQWGSNESDEFGRKVDKDGNVVYGRRLMGLDDDDDGNLRSYPTWIAKHYGWMLYLLAFSYTLLGFRVLCSDCQKENVFLKKALDAVAFDLTFWLPRKINDSWIFDDGTENEVDVQKYEEEQYLAHEKANSCSRVSLIVFFSVLFSFVNPSTFRGYPYVGVSMVFGIGLYNFTIVPAVMLLKKRKQRKKSGDKMVLLWSSEFASSQYSMSHVTRDFFFYVLAMLTLALFVARDALDRVGSDEVSNANDASILIGEKKTRVYSVGWRCGVWLCEIYASYLVFRRIWVLVCTYQIRWKKGREEKRAERKKKKDEEATKKDVESNDNMAPSSSVAIITSSKDACPTPESKVSVALEPPPPILVAERAENGAIRVSSPPKKSSPVTKDNEEEEEEEEEDKHSEEEKEEAIEKREEKEVDAPRIDNEIRHEQEDKQEEKEEIQSPRSSFVELSFAKKQLLKIERILWKPWVFLFNLTIPSCPDRKLNANEMNDNNTKNDNTTALPSIYFDNDVDSDSDWLSDSSYDSVTDINIKIERKKCKRRVLSIVCGMIWLAILSYAAVEFVTHLCNIFVQEYGNQILPIFGDGTNNIGKGSFESFIGSVVLSFLVSQSMDVHNSYFLGAPKAKETATTPGNDVIFRVALFDTLFNIGMPFCLVLPFYKKGNYNMEVPRNQTMNTAFFAVVGAAIIYYLVARVSMGMSMKKRGGFSSATELMVAWMFILTYIVAVGAISAITFTNVL